MECVATCAFGIEAVLKYELKTLGFDITKSENGKLYFTCDIQGLYVANMALATAERVFIVLGEETVTSFDALYDFVRTIPFETMLALDGRYIINAKSHKSTLFSLRDIQTITKKALIDTLKANTNQSTFLETGAPHAFLLSIERDQASLWLDTSGEGLHKRGYRLKQGPAPLKETLAAALVRLSFYHQDRVLYDPFCGSGTIPIEAALYAKNIAPSLNRAFAFQQFSWYDKQAFQRARSALLKAINHTVQPKIIASDNNEKVLDMARENADEAGVRDAISFQQKAFEDQKFQHDYGIIITNPPYGARLDDVEQLTPLYKTIAKRFNTLKSYSLYMLTSYPGVERIMAKKADRTRVLFNGNLKTRFYQYYGPKPS